MRPALACLLALLPVSARALEPVSALDDGFTVPSAVTMTESAYSYPGAEAFIDGSFLTAGWSMPHGVGELAVSTGMAGYGNGRFGVSASYSGTGFELYGDEQEKLGVAYRPLGWLSGGVRVTRLSMRIKGFGDASAVSADAGIVFRPHERFRAALAYEDIAGAELGASEEPVDGRVMGAASWEAVPGATILLSLSKVRRFQPSVSFGIVAGAMRMLTLGVIGANEPDRFEFLCGVRPGNAVFSYRSVYHRDLGMTHGFSISWCASGENVDGSER